MATEKKKKGYDDWELDSAVDSLVRAEEIKQDKKLLKAIQGRLKTKKKAISSIAELRGVYDEKVKNKMNTHNTHKSY